MRKNTISLFTVGCILVTVVVSGPLVPGITLTDHHEPRELASPNPGDGSVSLESVDVPDTLTLTKSWYGAGVYHLSFPDGHLTISNVTGEPLLVYRFQIDELNYVRGRTFFLSPESPTQLNVSLDRENFAPGRITKDAYDAEFVIIQRVNENDTVLYRENVTVTVRR